MSTAGSARGVADLLAMATSIGRRAPSVADLVERVGLAADEALTKARTPQEKLAAANLVEKYQALKRSSGDSKGKPVEIFIVPNCDSDEEAEAAVAGRNADPQVQ